MKGPFGDRVLVRVNEAEEVTAGGIIIPEKGKEKPTVGKVLAVGEMAKFPVKVGQEVLFSKFGGVKIKLSDFSPDGKEEELIILREGELLYGRE